MQQLILPRLLDRTAVIARIARMLAALSTDCAWRIEIAEHKPTRSSAQNRYLWGCCYPSILKAGGESLAGWTTDELHEFFLGEHFGWETVTGFGRKKLRPIRRSSRLNKQEFADFIAFIQQRSAEYGIYVPDADPAWFLTDEAA